jgi:phosphohistidine phosphatase
MDIILIRHADAESGASYADDSMRALTPKGRRVQEQVAKALHHRGFSPDIILHSPRLRAEQTAWITAQVLPGDVPVVEIQELDGGYALEDLLKRLASYQDCQTISCVGHEPDMTFWTNQLLGSNEKPAPGFSKSGVASIQFRDHPTASEGHLNFFYTADDLMLK